MVSGLNTHTNTHISRFNTLHCAQLRSASHTVAGRMKQRQPKHWSDVTIPAVDVFRGQGFSTGRLEKPLRMEVFPSVLTSTAYSTCWWPPEPVWDVTRHDWAQEASPGGQDGREIHCQGSQPFSFDAPLRSSAPGVWLMGHRATVTRAPATSCFGCKSDLQS